MDIVLGPNRYGMAEVRLVKVTRGEPHEMVDLNVSVALAGDLAGSQLSGDNAHVPPTDTQKNTVYAFAREPGVDQIEEFALRLARHFVDSQPAVERARVMIEEYGWRRLGSHSFQRTGAETRTATVYCDGTRAQVVSGVTDLVLLNTTGSELDGIVATSVTARWRHSGADSWWRESYVSARDHLIAAFTETHSLALQQTLYAMGRRVLEHRPELVEVRLSLPNKHHFLVDLAPFELDNPGEVFYAADRPYELIEGTVVRDGAPPSMEGAWSL